MDSPNFENLLIDQSRNRDAYAPAADVFFWAIDTGQLSVGDGTTWYTIYSPDRATGHPQVAVPGRVQAVIDDVATTDEFGTGGSTVVKLDPAKEYAPASPWRVKRGVVLDFNGATIRPTTDTDLLYLYPDATLRNVRVDVRDVDYSSTVLTIDTAFDGPYGPVVNKATVDGGRIVGSPGSGTAIRLRAGANGNIAHPELEVNLQGFDTGIDVYAAQGSSTYINAVRFEGVLMNYRLGIDQRGAGKTNGNRFRIFAQPLEGHTETLWRLDGTAEYNLLCGEIWDKQLYGELVWYIAPDTGGYNLLHSTLPFLDDGDVSNRSEDTNVMSSPYRRQTDTV
jgi:hypothetical protein